jgi:thioredoxin 1
LGSHNLEKPIWKLGKNHTGLARGLVEVTRIHLGEGTKSSQPTLRLAPDGCSTTGRPGNNASGSAVLGGAGCRIERRRAIAGPNRIMAGITEITDENFEAEVASSDAPVLLDFWAEWCHPCHMVAPEVEAIAESEGGRLKVGKLNVDNSPGTAGRFGVFSIPTLLLFVDGEEKARMVGVRRREAILEEIRPYLATTASA